MKKDEEWVFNRLSILPLHGVYVMYEVWVHKTRASFKYQPRGSTETWAKHLPYSWAVQLLRNHPHVGGSLDFG